MTDSDGTPVRDVLIDRLRDNSVPRGRIDPYKVVLAVEGGGMRGAVSSGMLLALEQLGLRSSFDEVVGTSAGALAGAFFVTGDGTRGSALYYTVLNSARFVDRRRLIRSGPVLDLDYLLDDAFEPHGFSWSTLIESDIPLWATVTPATPSNEKTLFLVGESPERAKAVLAASASLPVIAGATREIDSELYVDGGMLEAVPWVSAIKRGATHVLVARSRGFNESGGPEGPTLFERTAVPRMVKRMHGDHVADMVNESPERFWFNTEALRAVISNEARPVAESGRDRVEIDVVVPSSDTELPDRLEVDTHVLMDALAAGARAMIDYLAIEGFSVEQRIMVTHPRAPIGRVRSSVLAPIVASPRGMSRHGGPK
jgi:predicted patatin/cPLA2 family phospholipase